MKVSATAQQEIDVKFAQCFIAPRYFEDAIVDGVDDDEQNPQIPEMYTIDGIRYWCPIINIETGEIINWKQGVTAFVHYKSCDENYIRFSDDDDNTVQIYSGYVPKLLDPTNDGYGDYVIMHIDENGFIEDFTCDLSDVSFGKKYEYPSKLFN